MSSELICSVEFLELRLIQSMCSARPLGCPTELVGDGESQGERSAIDNMEERLLLGTTGSKPFTGIFPLQGECLGA